MRRILMLAAALAIPVSGATVALVSTPAWAGGSIVCTTLNNPSTGNLQATGCTVTPTGGSSAVFPFLALASGGTIPWSNGQSTTIATPVVKSTSAKKCPGYSKVKGATEPTAVKFTAASTTTSAGIKNPGKATGEVCISADGSTITALKPLKIT